MGWFASAFLAVLCASSASLAADSDAAHAYWWSATALHPTQFSHSAFVVQGKRAEIREKIEKGKLEKYLKDNPVPVILGPHRVPYILDGHHQTRALLEEKANGGEVWIAVVADYSALSMDAFRERMIAEGRFYLRKPGAREDSKPSELPLDVFGLVDDPYRGLAMLVRRHGGYDKTTVPYAEFLWAEYLRERVTLEIPPGTEPAEQESYLNVVLTESLHWAWWHEARDLPGYNGPDYGYGKQSQCAAALEKLTKLF